MKRRIIIRNIFAGAAFGVVLAGCCMIDEDLSDCGQETKVDYELELVTNVSTEVHDQLNAQHDEELALTTKGSLDNIFTDHAQDVDLMFFDTRGDSTLLHRDKHIMNNSEQSYSLYIPRQKYMHLTVANIEGNPVVSLEGTENCNKACLRQIDGDTINSHNTGIFTARQEMEMIDGIDQTFNVKLYMANCATMLVVDPNGHDISGMNVFTTGFATAFHIADSVYEYKTPAPLIRTKRMQADKNGHIGFLSVNFPSREPGSNPLRATDTRSVIETTEPFIAQPGEEVLWEFHIFLPQPDGTTTKTVLGIREPLRAGQFKIVRVKIGNSGQVEAENPDVGVSVTLDWKPGGIYHPDL